MLSSLNENCANFVLKLDDDKLFSYYFSSDTDKVSTSFDVAFSTPCLEL